MVSAASRAIWEFLKRTDDPPEVARDEWLTVQALLYSFPRGLSRNLISDRAWRKFLEFARHRLRPHPAREAFREKYGHYSPGLLTVSPTRACNLTCRGCYAGTEDRPGTRSFSVFDWLLGEMEEFWGASFVVISGGEPFLTAARGRISSTWLKPTPTFISSFTPTARGSTGRSRGNWPIATPAISVEGKAPTTEERRGSGVFNQIRSAFANLREFGVPFKISMTDMCQNYDELLSEEVVSFHFDGQRALYGWIFQYMPIGKGYDLSPHGDP